MKTIEINKYIFQYKIDWENSDIKGCWTIFYHGTEIKSYLFFTRQVPKYAFSLPINIESEEYSKDFLRDVITARMLKYFSDEARKQEIKSGNLI